MAPDPQTTEYTAPLSLGLTFGRERRDRLAAEHVARVPGARRRFRPVGTIDSAYRAARDQLVAAIRAQNRAALDPLGAVDASLLAGYAFAAGKFPAAVPAEDGLILYLLPAEIALSHRVPVAPNLP